MYRYIDRVVGIYKKSSTYSVVYKLSKSRCYGSQAFQYTQNFRDDSLEPVIQMGHSAPIYQKDLQTLIC